MEQNSEPEYSLFLSLPYEGNAIKQFIKEERQRLTSIYGECDKEIDATPIYINNVNKVLSGTLEFRFCVFVFGNAKKCVIVTRFYKVIIPFSKINGFKSIDENTLEIDIDNLSFSTIQLEFNNSTDANNMKGVLTVITKKMMIDMSPNEDVEIKRHSLDDELEKINPNGEVSLNQMNNGCSLTLFILIASSIACGIALL